MVILMYNAQIWLNTQMNMCLLFERNILKTFKEPEDKIYCPI